MKDQAIKQLMQDIRDCLLSETAEPIDTNDVPLLALAVMDLTENLLAELNEANKRLASRRIAFAEEGAETEHALN